jgi:hypothetical protein
MYDIYKTSFVVSGQDWPGTTAVLTRVTLDS